MVDKNFIEKTLTNIIGKHSDFLYNIEGTLREITDNKEEYKILKNDIWRFWMETKKSTHEEVVMKGKDNSFFENRGGKETSVAFTDEMKTYAKENEVLYTIHNHPNNSSCFQSSNDIQLMVNYGVKYSVTVGDDGMMIVKNNNINELSSSETFDFFIGAKSACDNLHISVGKQFEEKYESKLNELKKKYNITNFSKLEDIKKYRQEENPLYQEFLINNFDTFITGLKNNFKKENVDINVYHVPKKPRVY